MMGQNFTRIVEECLHRLDRGDNLPEVLAEYPAYAERLKPLLLVAMASRAMDVQVPNQTAKRMGRNQMLAEMDQISSKDYFHDYLGFTKVKSWFIKLVNTGRARSLAAQKPSYRLAVAALVMAFGIGLFTISASASPMPGKVLNNFVGDIQQALGVLTPGSKVHQKSFIPNGLFNGGSLFLGDNLAAKVAFLLSDVEQGDDNDQSYDYQSQYEYYYQQASRMIEDEGDPTATTMEDTSGDTSDKLADLPETSAATYAPGQQDGPATDFAPGQQDGPATDYAPGQVKKLDSEDEQDDGDEDKDKDKEDKDKDKDK